MIDIAPNKCAKCGGPRSQYTGRLCRRCYEVPATTLGMKTTRREREEWREWVKTTPYTSCGLTEIADDADAGQDALEWLVSEYKLLRADGYHETMSRRLIAAIDAARAAEAKS